jgi:hypothetical protein
MEAKEYFKRNLQPLLIGMLIGVTYMATLDIIENIIVKIALIINH